MTRTLLATLLLIVATALADGPPPAGAGPLLHYFGVDDAGRELLVSVRTSEDGNEAEAWIVSAPHAQADSEPVSLLLRGPLRADGDRLTLHTDAGRLEWGAYREERNDALRWRPDPHGSATLHLTVPALQADLAAIGVQQTVRIDLSDASLTVRSSAPFYYRPPWRDLPLAERERSAVQAPWADGLRERSARPDALTGWWWWQRDVTVASLGTRLASVLVAVDSYTGGAHPNLTFEAVTYLRSDGDGGSAWREATGPCDALAHVAAQACDLDAVREAVHRRLWEMEATWVRQGTLPAAELPLRFTLTPAGIAFHFAPYEAGPYAQGPFQVELSFQELRQEGVIE